MDPMSPTPVGYQQEVKIPPIPSEDYSNPSNDDIIDPIYQSFDQSVQNLECLLENRITIDELKEKNIMRGRFW